MRSPCLLMLSGCFVLGEAGYTNTLDPKTSGGGSLVVRAGPNTIDEPNTHTLLDFAVRGDIAASGSRGAAGVGVAFAPWFGRDYTATPFIRGSLWVDPLRGGAADNDNLFLPAIELGVLRFPHDSGDALYSFGVRAEWLGRPGDTASSIGWLVYAGIGTKTRLTIPP